MVWRSQPRTLQKTDSNFSLARVLHDSLDSRWWFQTYFGFTPTQGNDPTWRAYFSDGWLNHPLVLCGRSKFLNLSLAPWEGFLSTKFCELKWLRILTRWAPTSYRLGYNSYKYGYHPRAIYWGYNSRGPPCRLLLSFVAIHLKEWWVCSHPSLESRCFWWEFNALSSLQPAFVQVVLVTWGFVSVEMIFYRFYHGKITMLHHRLGEDCFVHFSKHHGHAIQIHGYKGIYLPKLVSSTGVFF